MAIKFYKPTTPGRRKTSILSFLELTKKEPEKKLTLREKNHSGRNNTGQITVRHRGGGSIKKIRLVDFLREKYDMPAKVTALEYDPGRTARIALVVYNDGEKRYILAADGLKVGDEVVSSQHKVDIKVGNRMPLEFIPAGIMVYNISLEPGKKAVMARAAGSGVHLQAIEGKFAQLKMPSGEIRLVKKECSAEIGQVSNVDHMLVRIGKAGRRRNKGWRPTVRGKVMNPCDHPHGGGEGRHSVGMPYPKTKWGKHALGVKTRKAKKWSNKMIVKRRR